MEKDNTIGRLLRTSREKKNLSINQVAAKTKINLNVLKHLENDEFDKLPNITYVRGFVKNYAKTVGLDPVEAKRLLDEAYNQDSEEQPDAEVEPTKSEKQDVEKSEIKIAGISDEQAQELKESIISFIQGLFKKKVILPLIAVIILIIILKTIFSWVGNLINEPGKQIPINTELISEEVTTQNLQVISTPSQEPREETNEVNSNVEVVMNTDEQVATETVEEVKEEPKAIAPGKLPYRDFNPAPMQTFTTITDAPEAEDRRLLPPNVLASAQQGKQNVYIVADTDDTWLSFKVDDQPIKKFILRKDRRLFLKGDLVLVFIGNYNATKVFYNNKFVNAQTRSGVKSLIFPPDAAEDLVLPLFPSHNGVSYEASEYMKRMVKKED